MVLSPWLYAIITDGLTAGENRYITEIVLSPWLYAIMTDDLTAGENS